MKKLFVLPIILAALMLCAFAADSPVKLINKTHARLNEQLFNRLFEQKLQTKFKEQPVDVTVLSFSTAVQQVHLRNGEPDNDRQSPRVEFRCELIVKVGEESQHIRKNESYQAPYGTTPVTSPTPEQLIVNMIDKYYKFE